MRASVTVILSDGSRQVLFPGDFIGRSPRAGLSLNEPTLSEAHALVSLRGTRLRFLALRGRMSVGGKPVTDVVLRPGLRVVLSSRVPLVVERVTLPDAVLAIEAEDLAPRIVSGVAAIMLEPALELRPGAHADAAALVWTHEDRLWVRRGEGDVDLGHGDTFTVTRGGRSAMLRVVAVPLGEAGVSSTIEDPPLGAALVLRVRFDTVHIEVAPPRGARPEATCVLDGKNARLLSELALMGGPTDWEVVAREVWDDGVDTAVLRERWDATLGRLRRRLREAGVRPDLVRATRSGQVELRLGPRDRLEDET